MDKQELDNRFTYHAPKEGQPKIYEDIRAAVKNVAYLMYTVVPESRELGLAVTALEEAVFWANAGVARRAS